MTKSQLREERAHLVARIEEIDAALVQEPLIGLLVRKSGHVYRIEQVFTGSQEGWLRVRERYANGRFSKRSGIIRDDAWEKVVE